MRHRDFFAFCASLKPQQQKAVNQLSWVRQLAEGEVLYSPGEPGNALYIVTLGALEMLPPKNRQNGSSIIFGRGDVVGDLEVFADTRRAQVVKAKEATSLQCFPRTNFAQLLQLVPSFFFFVCEHMASRSLQERHVAAEQEERQELSGRILNFDLTTVHQTIMSSGQSGKLTLKDGAKQVIGAFYFDAGRLFAGTFQHLEGEEAFWQLFQVEKFPGTFTFAVGDSEHADLSEASRIAANGGDLLINALYFRDELDALKKGMQNCSGALSARGGELRWTDSAPEHLKPLAEQIWQLLSAGPKTMRELYAQCRVCELKLHEVVSELLYSNQVAFASSVQHPDINNLTPLQSLQESPSALFPSHTNC